MQNYQDAMAIVATLGNPDLFITITCNPLWSEIANNLLPRQIWGDLVCRVFRLKLKAILHDICKSIHVIEFQKRGLSYAHLLVNLPNIDKFSTAEDLDCIISAKIPDATTHPRLHAIVK